MPLNLMRRRLLSALPVLAATIPWPSTTRAQTRVDSARVLCGYPPGSSLDLISRRIADRLAGRYARTCIVENRPGAAGRLAVAELKKSPADGSTLLVTPSSVLTLYLTIYRDLAYDPFVDTTPVSIVAVTTFALAIGPQVPSAVATLSDFVRWAKANPSLANCGNAGAGSMPHFMAMVLAQESGVALTHVPFKGGSVAMQAVAGGQVASALATESAALAMAQAGRIRVIATTGNARSSLYPAAETFAEAGYRKLTQREWFGAFLPGKASLVTVEVLNASVRELIAEPETRETFQRIGLSAESSTPAQAREAMRADHDFWKPVIEASGFKPEQ